MKTLALTFKRWKAETLAGIPEVDPRLLLQSRAARIGMGVVRAAHLVQKIEPLATIVLAGRLPSLVFAEGRTLVRTTKVSCHASKPEPHMRESPIVIPTPTLLSK